MKAVELFLVLFRSNYPEVNKELARLQVISFIMDLFFHYEWNNMLHGLVESIIRTILDTDSLVLKQSCFHDGKLSQRVFDAYSKNAEHVKKRRGCRLGYMGHLVRLCSAIAYVLDRDVKLKQTLLGEQEKDWDAFVSGPLHQDNETHNAVLAGGAPNFPTETEDPQHNQFATASAFTTGGGGGATTTTLATNNPKEDDDPFDDTFNPPSSYELPREEDDWNNIANHQFTDEWRPDMYGSRGETGGEEHSDSSDEDLQPNFTPVDSGGGSSDEEDEEFRGKGKKKGQAKEDGKNGPSPVKTLEVPPPDSNSSTTATTLTNSTSTNSTPESTSTTTTTTTTTNSTRPHNAGDEWAAFEE